MKKRWKVLIGVLGVVVLGAAGVRFVDCLLSSGGGGMYEPSQNGQYVAHASSLSVKHFWGGSRSYLEFYVVDAKGVVLRRAEIDDAKTDPVFWRGGGKIVWDASGTRVNFISDDMTLVLPVR